MGSDHPRCSQSSWLTQGKTQAADIHKPHVRLYISQGPVPWGLAGNSESSMSLWDSRARPCYLAL